MRGDISMLATSITLLFSIKPTPLIILKQIVTKIWEILCQKLTTNQ